MRNITISESNSNKRIDRLIFDTFPNVPAGAVYKALRKRDVKVDGIRIKEDYKVKAGENVEIYITDDILDGIPMYETVVNQGFEVVYEDKNLIIVNKQQGIPVHPDREQTTDTLIDLIKKYMITEGEFTPLKTGAFSPALCHRLDRNTGGLVIIAKNEASLKILLDKIKTKEIRKYYLCLIQGNMKKDADELKAYLFKDEKKSRVFIDDIKGKGSVEIITRYKVLENYSDKSLLEVELVTGRTHQIRAHLAYSGHPVLGDGKYGRNEYNRSTGLKYQALWAYKTIFDFQTDSGILNYLKGKVIEIKPDFK